MRTTLMASAFLAFLIGSPGWAATTGGAAVVEAPPPSGAKGELDSLSAAEIRALQDALIWTGDYVGLANGTLGARTRDAVAAYLKRSGASPTAPFEAAARARLLADAKARRQAVGFASVKDGRAGVAISLPTKLLQREIGTEAGTRYSSADGDLVVDTLSRPAAAGGLPELYARMSAAAGSRKVSYKLLRPDFFVVAGEVGERSFYSRFAAGRDEDADVVRGFTISYPKAAAARLDPVTLAVAASFEPFPAGLKAPGTEKPAAGMADAPVPHPRPVAVAPMLVDAVQVGPDVVLARVSSAACANPKVEGAAATFRSEDQKTGLALLSVSRRAAMPAFMSMPAPRQADRLVALFRGTALADRGAVTPLQAAAVEIAGAPAPSAAAFAVSAPLQGRAAFLFDLSGGLAGVTEPASRAPPAIAGTVLQADYRATGAGPIAAFLARNGLAPSAESSRPVRDFVDVASAARQSIVSITCEAAGVTNP